MLMVTMKIINKQKHKKMKLSKKALTATVILALSASVFTGCEEKSNSEKVEDKVEETGEEIKDEVDDAKEEIEDEVDDAQ